MTGHLLFSKEDKEVHIQGLIFGLQTGLHGFHIHTTGNTSDNCRAADGHFNPHEEVHGSPEDKERHVGDLGNIITNEDGVTKVDIKDSAITLGDGGPNDILGRAVVVHKGKDDLGKGTGTEEEGSKKTGNAGERVACGIIKNEGNIKGSATLYRGPKWKK